MTTVMIQLDPEVYNELELFRLERETPSDAVFRLFSLHDQMRRFLEQLLEGEREEQKEEPRMAQTTYTLEELTEIINRYEKYFDDILRILENLTKRALEVDGDYAGLDRPVIDSFFYKGMKELMEKLRRK